MMIMWILFACGSALFAALTTILAKVGVRGTDSSLATAIRTFFALLLAWLLAVIDGSAAGIGAIDLNSLLFLILSGVATGASWLCYFRAIQLGSVNRVVPVDKSSVVLEVLLSFVLFRSFSAVKLVGIAVIAVGTYLMIARGKEEPSVSDRRWFPYACGSALFAALPSNLGALGVRAVAPHLALAIRVSVVFLMAWLVVFVKRVPGQIGKIDRRTWLFLMLSGVTCGLAWLCEYLSYAAGGEVSVVKPIDKCSILLTVLFSGIVFREKLTRKAAIGLALLLLGTLLMVFSSSIVTLLC